MLLIFENDAFCCKLNTILGVKTMRDTKRRKEFPERERATLLSSHHVDVDYLLRSAQEGIEDAEALLLRFPHRRPQANPSYLTPAWGEAYQSIETLSELHAAQDLKSVQAQRFEQLLERVKRLLPELQKHDLIAPQVELSDE